MTNEWQKNNRIKQKEYNKKSRIKHLEKRRQADNERYAADKSKWQQYYKDNRDERLKQCKDYKKTAVCKEYARKYMKRRSEDPTFRLISNLRCRVRRALTKTGSMKVAVMKEFIGCTVDQLRLYLESQFREGMSWDNYGKWHIDHIKPVASFDMNDPTQQRQCFYYTNLQPLWAMENFLKSDNINKENLEVSTPGSLIESSDLRQEPT